MALYSIQLRRYIDHFSQYENPKPSINKMIEIGQPHLFDFQYPFFDESKRKEFERKWIRRFYMTEIGFETFELFKFYLENWMNEKMPYYNQRFKSELIEFDPMLNTVMDREKNHKKDTDRHDDVDKTEDTIRNTDGTFHVDTQDKGEFASNTVTDGTSDSNGKRDAEGTSNKTGKKDSKGTSDEFARLVESDTPDNRLAITTEDGKGILEYASKINENITKGSTTDLDDITEDVKTTGTETSESHNTSKQTSDTTGTSKNDGFQDGRNHEDVKGNLIGNQKLQQNIGEVGNENEHYVGKIGTETYSEMLQKYRDTFIRIESEIYEECRKDLFMLVY